MSKQEQVIETLREVFNKQHPVTAKVIDLTWNANRIQGDATQVMNQAAENGLSEDQAINELVDNMKANRTRDKMISNATTFTLVVAAVTSTLPMISIPLAIVKCWHILSMTDKFAEKFPTLTNPAKDPTFDRARANEIVRKNYANRL